MSSNYGFKISPAGSDVKTVADKDTAFTSKFPNLKVAQSGNGTATPNANHYTLTIPHNLGYVPVWAVYVKPGYGSFNYRQIPESFIDAGNYFESYWVYADETNLYITVETNQISAAFPFNYFYYIFDETMFD